jgi:hypothetical protein
MNNEGKTGCNFKIEYADGDISQNVKNALMHADVTVEI